MNILHGLAIYLGASFTIITFVHAFVNEFMFLVVLIEKWLGALFQPRWEFLSFCLATLCSVTVLILEIICLLTFLSAFAHHITNTIHTP